jgi:RHS repeat-associated protein
MTDTNGALVEETAFYPFGIPRHEHRLRQIEEAYKFTQKERDRESGLHYFEARYLAGAISKFLSVDPKYASTGSSQGDPQALNLYAYVRNNPLQYTDPMGLDRDPPWVGAKASATASVNGDGDAAKAEKSCGASFSAGFGDSILPKLTLWGPAFFLTGLLGPSIGPSFEFGPAARGWLGINNVDEDSGCYTAGGVAQILTSFATGPRALGAAKGGFNLLSPILQYGGRDIVIVSDAAGRVQPMYRSTGWAGKTHGVKPGEWGPFDDIMGGQLMKSAYYGESGLAKTDPLYGFGTSGNKAMSQWLGAQSLPAGTDVGDAFSIINDAITKLKQK